ncbi:hypothetical protein [Streptomyces cavourensis]|uniref:hypothetical protein n=1 Tax=Streptomyces cavourensis TaxID=67258 RepID=UPI003F5D504C
MSPVDRLPMLLEAVLSIGSDLGLRATLQQIVDTATTLTGARHGALTSGSAPPSSRSWTPPRP